VPPIAALGLNIAHNSRSTIPENSKTSGVNVRTVRQHWDYMLGPSRRTDKRKRLLWVNHVAFAMSALLSAIHNTGRSHVPLR
jgi:hypothetical protein